MDDTTGSGDDLLDAANRLQASLNEDKVTHGQFVYMSHEKDIIILIQESLMLYEYMYMIVIILRLDTIV